MGGVLWLCWCWTAGAEPTAAWHCWWGWNDSDWQAPGRKEHGSLTGSPAALVPACWQTRASRDPEAMPPGAMHKPHQQMPC